MEHDLVSLSWRLQMLPRRRQTKTRAEKHKHLESLTSRVSLTNSPEFLPLRDSIVCMWRDERLHILDCDVPTSISLTWQPITISDTSRHNWEFPRYFFDIDNTIKLTDGLITGSLCPFPLYISLTSHFEFKIEFHLSVSMLTTYHIWPWQCHFLVHCGSKSPGFCGQVEGLLGGCLQIRKCHSYFRSGQATC